MELNMTEHGFDVNVSYSESKDFDNSVVLALINQLVEALRGVEDVSISISSEYAIDEDAEEVLEYMVTKYTDEDSEEESDEEDTEESDEDKTEEDK